MLHGLDDTLQAFIRVIQKGLPSLEGVYVTGSLLRPDFDPRISDVDLMVLLKGPVPTAAEQLVRLVAIRFSGLRHVPFFDVGVKDATALRDLTAYCLACKSHILLGPPVAAPAHLAGPQGQRELVELMRVEARAAMALLEDDDGPRRNRSLAKSKLRLMYLDTMAQPCAGVDVRLLWQQMRPHLDAAQQAQGLECMKNLQPQQAPP